MLGSSAEVSFCCGIMGGEGGEMLTTAVLDLTSKMRTNPAERK